MQNKEKIYCILTRKKNNFFASILKNNKKDVIFFKSCGTIKGIRGSKKYTTVAVESLGKEVFLKLFSLGYTEITVELVVRFKIDKFVRSYIRGLLLYGKKYLNLLIKTQIVVSHNGLRAKKQRRV